jgi:hypothetical protein
LEFAEAIQKLKTFSLITEKIGAQLFSMHRLVQPSTQKWLEHKNELSKWQETALSVLYSHCPPVAGYEDWALLGAMLPHLQVVLDYELSTKGC